MESQNTHNKVHLNKFIPLVLIGIGLIILGLVVIGVISGARRTSHYTVVPSAVNFPSPELSLNDLNGKKVAISDYRNQIVLINNWATWCPPCRDEMPTLSKYYESHSNQGFMLIGIEAGDPAADVEKFVNEYEITFPILLDPYNESLTAFKNDSLPSSYVIDQKGMVVLAWTGPINRVMLEKYVTPLLEQ